MERKHQAAFLHRPIDLHVGVVVHTHVGAHGRHHEAADVFSVAKSLDMAQRRIGIGERQTQHGKETVVGLRHHLFGEPAVIGPAQVRLHFLLRMHADIEHAGGEQAGIIDAHGVHPAMAELHVADLAGLGFFAGAHRIARHAAAHVLVAGRHRHDAGLMLLGAGRHRELPQHVVFHERQKFVVVFVLVVMRIDVDDQDVVEVALVRLLAGMRQQPRRVELLDGNAAAAVGNQIHDNAPGIFVAFLVIASEAKQSKLLCDAGLLRRGACHRAGHFGPDPLAPRNDGRSLRRVITLASGPALPHAEFEGGKVGGAQQSACRDHHVGGGD